MKAWRWQRLTDEDGHPYWKARHDGTTATIWRGGGDSGDYLLEDHSRYPDLPAAKEAARRKWDEK